jgi:biotin carboxyl carrier protein
MAGNNFTSFQPMKFKVRLNEEEKEIEVIRQGNLLRISYDGQTTEARLIYSEEAQFVLEIETPGPDDSTRRKQIRAAGFHDGDKRQLWANGRLVNYRRVREGTAAQSDAAGSLSASIPAVVSEILVSTGDRVVTGQKLILLESMKMVLPIQAPHDGLVSAIHCTAGEAVQPGFQLIELEQPD